MIAIWLLAVTLIIAIYLFDRSITKQRSQQFIERQQMQSKIDTLTEALLQQAGHPVDLNKGARAAFKSLVKDRAFSGGGWKRDIPATPPPPETKEK